MKYIANVFPRAALVPALALAAVIALAGSAGAAELVAENPIDLARPAEVVAIEWSKAVAAEPGLAEDNARVLDDSGAALLSQPVDNDGDGELDELLFVADFGPSEKKTFTLKADSSIALPETEGRAYARHVPERKDDFAWENDRVGFRAYGPGLADSIENCGIDCFMKRVEYPIIDKWYGMSKKAMSYHIDYGEGQDAYKVGDGLGCGGSAVWSGGKLQRPNVYRSWKRFANGPVRAVFELSYGPWEVGGKSVTQKKTITIDLGNQLFKVDDLFMVGGKPAALDIAVGLSTHGGAAEAFNDDSAGRLYAWEKIDNHYLGTAVLAPPESIVEYKYIDGDGKHDDHAIFVMKTGKDGGLSYHAGFGWEKAELIETSEEWESYLKDYSRRVEAPVSITIK